MRDIGRMRCTYLQAFYEIDSCLFGSRATRQLWIDVVNGITVHRMVLNINMLVSDGVQ